MTEGRFDSFHLITRRVSGAARARCNRQTVDIELGIESATTMQSH
jgi:hypothetical protein